MMGELIGILTPSESLRGTLSDAGSLSGNLSSTPQYNGSYEVTPSAETQVLNTAGMRMTENVTVNPIPSNYGLITWNGSVITVS